MSTFGDKPRTFRAADLKRTRLNADWDAINGPLGGVIAHLRARAARARRTAWAFLVLLFVTAGAGLVFYLGLPLWQSFLDGRLATLNATLRTIEAENAKLDGERDALRSAMAETLALTFEAIPTDTKAQLDGHVQQGDTLLLYGQGGTVLRARPDLSGFDTVPTGSDEWLSGHVHEGDRLLLYGNLGTLLRARPDLSGFDPVPTGTDAWLAGHVRQGDALMLYGGDGTVLRARPDLGGFDPVPTGTEAWLSGHVLQGDALLLYGQRGTVLRARADLSRFDPVPTGNDLALLLGHVRHGDALLLYGGLERSERDSLVLRARPDLSGFDPVVTETGAWLRSHVQRDDALLLYGDDGTLLRARPDLSGFDPLPTGTEGWINGHVQQGDALLFYGQRGTVLRARSDLSGVDPVPTGLPQDLFGHVQQGDALLLYGDGGTVLRQTDIRKQGAEALNLPAGPSGDAALMAFRDGLPPHLRDWSAVVAHAATLNGITNRRAALDILRDSTNAEIERYETSPLAYLRQDKALEFDRFLALCRGEGAPTADLTTACLSAWQSEQAGGQTWWRALVDQVPPGILLLFLLATSGGLYRYNLRLAGFHDSRADVLQLLSLGRDEGKLMEILAATPADVGNLTALVMAADKVEMGAIKAKLGQAEIELARALGAEKTGG